GCDECPSSNWFQLGSSFIFRHACRIRRPLYTCEWIDIPSSSWESCSRCRGSKSKLDRGQQADQRLVNHKLSLCRRPNTLELIRSPYWIRAAWDSWLFVPRWLRP